MNGLTTVTTKGQVTIPEAVRRALGVKVGDKVYFDKVLPEEKRVVMRLMSKNVVERLYGSLKSKKKFTDLQTIRKITGRRLAKRYGLK